SGRPPKTAGDEHRRPATRRRIFLDGASHRARAEGLRTCHRPIARTSRTSSGAARVIQGRYLRIPEGPADMDRLWELSAPLEPASLPVWLSRGDEGYYRIAGAVHVAGLSSADRAAYLAERAELAELGLVIEASPQEPEIEKFYVARPKPRNEWSIGVCRGLS